ncbi:hypothetical protein D3C87_1113010 [compost metagenome]
MVHDLQHIQDRHRRYLGGAADGDHVIPAVHGTHGGQRQQLRVDPLAVVGMNTPQQGLQHFQIGAAGELHIGTVHVRRQDWGLRIVEHRVPEVDRVDQIRPYDFHFPICKDQSVVFVLRDLPEIIFRHGQEISGGKTTHGLTPSN